MAAPIVAGKPQRIRRIRTAVTLLVALAFLGVAFYQAYGYIKEGPKAPTTATNCPTGSATAPIALPKDTKVNVYNSTSQAGLASEVANKLRERGFDVGEVDNDPTKKKISGIGELRYGPEGREEVRALIVAVPKAKRINDERTDAVVDLAIGAKFDDLIGEKCG